MIDDPVPPLGGSHSHGIRLRRLRLHAEGRTYDVDFRGADDSPRPLSVIAGAVSTGKTTILEFVDYCLGASDHPRHPEITPKVRAATLEVELSGSPYLIERAVGEPSTFAYVRAGRLDEPGATPPERRPVRPAGHPDSLSSLLLSHCKLEGVQLRDDLTRAEADTDPLSFRDLMWLCFLPNERLDDKNLLFENVTMKHLKLRQVVDVVFDIHDDHSVELGRRIRAVEADLVAARDAYRVAEQLVEEQQLGGRAELEALHRNAKSEMSEAALAVAALDTRARADTTFAEDLRERHRAAAHDARRAAAMLRDRETQVERMTALRTTYAEDVSKLTMLAEAGRLFEPLRVTACPSCLTPLAGSESRCGACQSDLTAQTATDGAAGALDVSAELRSAKAKLSELTDYLAELEREVPQLRVAAERAQEAEARAAAEVDVVTAHVVTPYLAQRDALARRREDAGAAIQRAAGGLRLMHSLERRAANIDRKAALLASLREELAGAGGQPSRTDRSTMIGRLGQRYRQILEEWRYPKIADAYLAENLTPYMRGKPYTAASAGGRTLIALAWQLALFEIAWETRSSHPGFLLLDSPQKNFGQTGEHGTDLADAATIEQIYRHLDTWLAGRGAGAQIVVADNAPPLSAASGIIVRFSRRPEQPPYGLIDDETS
ncbi:DNA recombination protein RecN [Plantactinospora sp. WMMB334]|uniref:DNA recombination protein RecN n=1 Tax=Plantactinospora sp. WMMB334 TaxID=3404119 RepID=UPI003B95243B